MIIIVNSREFREKAKEGKIIFDIRMIFFNPVLFECLILYPSQ
jgi:hypothetical protein